VVDSQSSIHSHEARRLVEPPALLEEIGRSIVKMKRTRSDFDIARSLSRSVVNRRQNKQKLTVYGWPEIAERKKGSGS